MAGLVPGMFRLCAVLKKITAAVQITCESLRDGKTGTEYK